MVDKKKFSKKSPFNESFSYFDLTYFEQASIIITKEKNLLELIGIFVAILALSQNTPELLIVWSGALLISIFLTVSLLLHLNKELDKMGEDTNVYFWAIYFTIILILLGFILYLASKNTKLGMVVLQIILGIGGNLYIISIGKQVSKTKNFKIKKIIGLISIGFSTIIFTAYIWNMFLYSFFEIWKISFLFISSGLLQTGTFIISKLKREQ